MEEMTMPKGWNNLSEEAKLGYVSADFVEKVDDAMADAMDEIANNKKTKDMSREEYMQYCLATMRKHVDPV